MTRLDLSGISEEQEANEIQEDSEIQEETAPEEVKAPSYIKVTIANLVCPGYGAWILGQKARGTLIFLVLMATLGLYFLEIQGQVFAQRDKIQKAVRSQQFQQIEGILRETIEICLNNIKLKFFIYGYLFSMLDSIFLVFNMRKETLNVT